MRKIQVQVEIYVKYDGLLHAAVTHPKPRYNSEQDRESKGLR